MICITMIHFSVIIGVLIKKIMGLDTKILSLSILYVIVITRSRDDYGKYNLRVIFPVSIACECYNELITR